MKNRLICLNRYKRLKTELENTNILFRETTRIKELQLLSKILSGTQLAIKFKEEGLTVPEENWYLTIMNKLNENRINN